MNAEELLRQAQVRCRILEADIEVETMRGTRYRNILGTFAGEDSSGATQPEASRFLHGARSLLTRPRLPAASPSSGPEALAIAQRPSPDGPDPSMVGRKSNPSSVEDTAGSSKRMRRFFNVPQSTTSESCDTRVLVPRDGFDVDVEGTIKRAGLTPLVLTRAEASRAKETPGIGWKRFNRAFDGKVDKNLDFECLQCFKVPGYEDFVCTSIVAQPFIPLAPGKPGLLLRLPAVIGTPQSERGKSAFHVFSAMQPKGALHYRGKYTIVPLPQLQFIWTSKFPKRFLESWVKRVFRNSDTMRAIRARIELRNEIEREPSASEVQAYMRHYFTDQVTYKEVSAAFRSGKEKLALEGIECMEYDFHLAAIIEREA